ncbi:MAG: sugar-binding protein [Planctomycetota bacterium]
MMRTILLVVVLVPVASVSGNIGGSSWSLQSQPQPPVTRANFELWISEDTKVVRGIIVVADYQAGRRIYHESEWRAFATEHSLALLLHDMRAPEQGRPGRLPLGQKGIDEIDAALAHFATETGSPDLASRPLILTGLSQSAWQAMSWAVLIPDRVAAVLPSRGGYWTDDFSPMHGVPTLFLLAQHDRFGITPRAYTFVARQREEGAAWAAVIEPGIQHHIPGHPEFSRMWLSEILDRRLPETPGKPLKVVDTSKGWIASHRFTWDHLVAEVELKPAGQAEVPFHVGDRGHWFPTRALADAWLNVSLAGRIDDLGEAEELAMPVRRIKTDVTIDGQTDDWTDLGDVLWPAEVSGGAEPWQGPDDTSIRIATGFDDEMVYFAIRVEDDELFLNGQSAWQQDGVELRIDARPTAERGSNPGVRENTYLLVAIGPDAAGQHRVHQPSALPEGTQWAVATSDVGYEVEIAVPSAYFDQKAGTAWDRFRLNVAVNDMDTADDGEPTRQVLHWRPDWLGAKSTFGSGTAFKVDGDTATGS